MATIQIYNEELDKFFTVSVDLNSQVIDRISDQATGASTDFFLKISSNILKPNNSATETFYVRTLEDVAPGYGAANNFTDVINSYIQYYILRGEIGMSSSDSSSSSSSSSELYSVSSLSSLSLTSVSSVSSLSSSSFSSDSSGSSMGYSSDSSESSESSLEYSSESSKSSLEYSSESSKSSLEYSSDSSPGI